MIQVGYFLLGFMMLPGFCRGQFDTYTYVSDRRFNDPTDLLGWQFSPGELEVKDEKKINLMPGEYKFGVTQSNLFVEGGEFTGVYSINNINPMEYGYILNLMNARNPTLQGHLKVILNKNRQVDAIVFKRSPKEKESIFWMPLLTAREYKLEGDWFTDRKELFLPVMDSLWTAQVHPFLVLDHIEGKQIKLTMDDSTYFHFSREIARSMKDKKKRKKGEVSLVDSLGLTIEDLLADTMLLEAAGVEIQERIADFVRFKTRLVYKDGGSKWIDELLEITKIQERMDKRESARDEKYLWELTIKNGDTMQLYFDNSRFITSIVWDGRRYLMRGF